MSDGVLDQSGGRGEDGGRPYAVLLFADLCDSVPLAEAVDPEELVRLFQRFEHIALEIVEKHGGKACQLRGDGVLVVFGYPTPMEDAARRAVEAAVELHEAIREAVFPEVPRDFDMRLHSGVHAGRIFARTGDELRGRYEVLGAAVNTAARLCDSASRDDVLVSDSVLSGIQGFFVTEAAEPLDLKGTLKPVLAHRVRRRSDVDSRFEARTRFGLTEFVGRETELEHLSDTLAQCVPGPPRTVLVSGAPGIGKTRTLAEFRRRVDRSGIRVLHGTCDSYGAMTLYGPFVQVLRQVFGIESIEDPDEAAERVGASARGLGLAVASHLDDFLQLLSIGPTLAEGQSQRVRASAAFGPLFEVLNAREPMLLILDDWQWADTGSRDLLKRIRSQRTVRGMCIVIGAREEAVPELVLEEADAFALRPFSEAESAKMIRKLRPNILDLGITRAIHSRTGGNPLFVEELCRSLPADALVGERSLEESVLSTTLQGVIQARVSALPAAQARVIGAASVIGNEFTSAMVARGVPGEDVDAVLAELARGDLIHAEGASGAFRFRHGITREAIYESVRRDERREIHSAIAAAIEERLPNPEVSDQLETLAYHYRGSGDPEHAARYAELAGDQALATSALDRARAQLSTALLELDALPATRDLKQRWLGVYAKWVAVYVYSPSPMQLATSEQATAYADEVGDDTARAHTAHWGVWMHYVLGEYRTAIEVGKAALAVAEELEGSGRLAAQLSATIGQCYAAGGRSEAFDYLERALSLKRHRGSASRGGTLPMGFAYAVASRASLLGSLGDFTEAHRDIEEAVAAVGGTGHPIEGSVGALECTIHICQGNWQRLITTAMRTREVSARVNSAYTFAMVSVFAEYARWMLQPSASPPADMIQTVEWLTARDTGLYASLNYGCLAEAFASAGAYEASDEFARRALGRVAHGDRFGEAMGYRALARAEHARDPGGEATRSLMVKAWDTARDRGSRREVAVTDLLQAQFDTELGERREAEEGARKALVALEAMEMEWHALQAEALLAGTR